MTAAAITTTRGCATCGRSITVTSRNPNRRYCTARCRVADWRRRNRTRRPNPVPNAVAAVASDVPGLNAVPAAANGVPRPGNADLASGSPARCPRCQTPLTVLTWLLPPAAAQVTTPTPPQHG